MKHTTTDFENINGGKKVKLTLSEIKARAIAEREARQRITAAKYNIVERKETLLPQTITTVDVELEQIKLRSKMLEEERANRRQAVMESLYVPTVIANVVSPVTSTIRSAVNSFTEPVLNSQERHFLSMGKKQAVYEQRERVKKALKKYKTKEY